MRHFSKCLFSHFASNLIDRLMYQIFLSVSRVDFLFFVSVFLLTLFLLMKRKTLRWMRESYESYDSPSQTVSSLKLRQPFTYGYAQRCMLANFWWKMNNFFCKPLFCVQLGDLGDLGCAITGNVFNPYIAIDLLEEHYVRTIHFTFPE